VVESDPVVGFPVESMREDLNISIQFVDAHAEIAGARR